MRYVAVRYPQGMRKVYPFQKRVQGWKQPQEYWTDYKYDPTVDVEGLAQELDSLFDSSKPIRVDKSHSLIGQAPQLYQHYRAKGSVVKFIVLVGDPSDPQAFPTG